MKKAFYKILAFPIFLYIGVSCIQEDLSNCASQITVTVRIDENSTSNNNESIVKDVILYIFDQNKRLIEIRDTQVGKSESVNHPDGGKLTVIAWCNTKNGSVDLTSLSIGSSISDGKLSLKRTSLPNTYQIPDDIFGGSVMITNDQQQNEDAILYVSRVVASMNITVVNLKKYAGFNDNNYSFLVGPTKSNINFSGEYAGGDAHFMPESSFNAQNEFLAKTFRLFPSRNEVFSVKIFHESTLIDEVLIDNDSIPLQTIENKTLNLLIVYNDVDVDVIIKTTEWNKVYLWDIIIE